MSFWSNVSPLRAYRDLRDQLGTPQPYRWRFMALAGAVTLSIFLLMFDQGGRAAPKPPEIMYFPSFLPGRTDAEIIEGNRIATEAFKREQAEDFAREDRIRRMYKVLGDATGVETEKAYQAGTAEREARLKAQREAREAILKDHLVKHPN